MSTPHCPVGESCAMFLPPSGAVSAAATSKPKEAWVGMRCLKVGGVDIDNALDGETRATCDSCEYQAWVKTRTLCTYYNEYYIELSSF